MYFIRVKYSDFIQGINTLYIGNFNKRFHDFGKISTFFDEDRIIGGYNT